MDLLPEDEEELLQVFRSTSLEIRTRIAALTHQSVTPASVHQVILGGRGAGELALASTDHESVLGYWSESVVPETRAIVAFNPSTAEDRLVQLVGDPSPLVRVNAAMNSNLPSSVRARVALSDADPRVREAVVWAMTTVEGRNVLEGARFAHTKADASEDAVPNPSEYLVTFYAL